VQARAGYSEIQADILASLSVAIIPEIENFIQIK
jgi:hypothetical protein